ncbi:MAG: hypothetical protein ACOZIN_18370 [Myxococcota bacterium]
MRGFVLFGVMAAGCVSIEQFEGRQFRCDTDEQCSSDAWCHAKSLVTGGQEGGNVCVPRGEHYCGGVKCPEGQRCQSFPVNASANCVPCTSPCSPLRDQPDGHGGGGGGGGGGGNEGECNSASCPQEEACVAAACARPCIEPVPPNCISCRFAALVTDFSVTKGGGCLPGADADCSTLGCPSGQSCAIFLQGDAGVALRCTGAAANGKASCRTGQDCSSGICVTGFCRDACTASKSPGCPSCVTRQDFPSGTGYCN